MYFTLGGFQTAQEQTFHFNMNNKSIMFKCILYAELEEDIRLIRFLQKSYGCCKKIAFHEVINGNYYPGDVSDSIAVHRAMSSILVSVLLL